MYVCIYLYLYLYLYIYTHTYIHTHTWYPNTGDAAADFVQRQRHRQPSHVPPLLISRQKTKGLDGGVPDCAKDSA